MMIDEAKCKVMIGTGEGRRKLHIAADRSQYAVDYWKTFWTMSSTLEGQLKQEEIYRSTSPYSIIQMSVLVIKENLWSDPAAIIPGHFGWPQICITLEKNVSKWNQKVYMIQSQS